MDVTNLSDGIKDVTSFLQALQWIIGVLLFVVAGLVTTVVYLFKTNVRQIRHSEDEKRELIIQMNLEKNEMNSKLLELSTNNLSILKDLQHTTNTQTQALVKIPSELKSHIDSQTALLKEIIEGAKGI